MRFHTPSNQCTYQITTCTLQFPRYSPEKILKVMVTAARVKSRLRHDVAYPPPKQCPYKVSTSYTLQFLKQPGRVFIKSMSLQQVQSRSHHGAAHLYPQPMSLPGKNFLHLTVSEKWPGEDFQNLSTPGCTLHRHPISLPSISILHLMVSEIQPSQSLKTFVTALKHLIAFFFSLFSFCPFPHQCIHVPCSCEAKKGQ